MKTVIITFQDKVFRYTFENENISDVIPSTIAKHRDTLNMIEQVHPEQNTEAYRNIENAIKIEIISV